MLSVVYYWEYWGRVAAYTLMATVPVGLYIFNQQRNATRAAVLVLLGTWMLLPEQARFDYPMLPAFDKYNIAGLTVLAGALWRAPQRVRAARLGRHPIDLLFVLMALGGIGTVFTNQDKLVYGGWKITRIPGLTWYDAASIGLGDFMSVGIPFVLGRIFLRTAADVRVFFRLLASAGVLYSLPILYEVRMSPMLHMHLYGFMARLDWAQNVRDGGYRPTVFMGHALVVGFFMCLTIIATLSLKKSGQRSLFGIGINVVTWFLLAVLVLCKTSGALLFALLSAVVLLYGSIKAQLRVAVIFSVIVLAYPALRVTEIMPADAIVNFVAKISEDRAGSLRFRFDNEDVLAMKGTERMWFGWGGYGRERIYDESTGRNLTVQDGHWIIQYGQRGLVGFLCFYGLQLLPVVMTMLRMGRIADRSDRALLAGFAFIVSLCALNTLPNMHTPVIPLFLSGGLVALLAELPRQRALAQARERRASRSVPPPQPSVPPEAAARVQS